MRLSLVYTKGNRMRSNLDERDTLRGLTAMIREHPEHESVLYSAISYLAGLVYEQDQRARTVADTFRVTP
jgi:hypothetical protein